MVAREVAQCKYLLCKHKGLCLNHHHVKSQAWLHVPVAPALKGQVELGNLLTSKPSQNRELPVL